MNAARSLRPLRPSRATALIACALTLALWFASMLGLMHSATHAPGLEPGTGMAGMTDSLDANRGALQAVAKLFDGHDAGDAQCRIYDQLANGPAVVAVPLVVLPLVLPAATFDFFQGEALARWVALFQARGPPPSR